MIPEAMGIADEALGTPALPEHRWVISRIWSGPIRKREMQGPKPQKHQSVYKGLKNTVIAGNLLNREM